MLRQTEIAFHLFLCLALNSLSSIAKEQKEKEIERVRERGGRGRLFRLGPWVDFCFYTTIFQVSYDQAERERETIKIASQRIWPMALPSARRGSSLSRGMCRCRWALK